jgi:hypothetical protein
VRIIPLESRHGDVARVRLRDGVCFFDDFYMRACVIDASIQCERMRPTRMNSDCSEIRARVVRLHCVALLLRNNDALALRDEMWLVSSNGKFPAHEL